MTIIRNELSKLWKILYPDLGTKQLDAFLSELKEFKENMKSVGKDDQLWYKNAVVYSLYVDLFATDFVGLSSKIPYLQDLGVNCLWLLPVLESPMRDAGFDISDYRKIRSDLLTEKGDDSFDQFLELAHKSGIKVIFDIAINHTSNQHDWFKRSALPEKNKYSDYYIWSDNDRTYSDCRLLFKGMCDSNWEKYDDNRYYFHRFFEFQPDLNYRNPNVLIDMCRNFMFWIDKGVDGFRADAIPYLWKEEGTSCENLENTHVIIKFFRTVTDYLKSDVILLAEACQPPAEVVKYMGDEDECHAGYHFPLMPQVFKALSLKSSLPIINVLNKDVTPEIPQSCQWFTFLRCHDELSLELVYVNEEDRKYIHDNYCHKPEWDFRMGEGVSARLSELFKFDSDKIILAFSIILTLPGTPVIYYGDEFGKANDTDYYKYQVEITGHNDTRNFVRGKLDWPKLEKSLKKADSFESRTFQGLKKMIAVRKQYDVFGSGTLEFLKSGDGIMAYYRTTDSTKILVIHNLNDNKSDISDFVGGNAITVLGEVLKNHEKCFIEAHKTIWLKIE
jgi:maltose alpha-D-glucosyltransferase / alpha-amylase